MLLGLFLLCLLLMRLLLFALFFMGLLLLMLGRLFMMPCLAKVPHYRPRGNAAGARL